MVTSRDGRTAEDFPVICVGGSAGGLDAYTRLLRHLPADLGATVVIVNHLRVVDTLLHKLLPRHTRLPVELITEGLHLRPNTVFIIPAGRDLHVRDGRFRLEPISKMRGWPNVITLFLRSLTEHWGGRLVAVIVSGKGDDGAAALCCIRAVGGVTIAHRLDTAEEPDMPASAIASGCVDFVLAPEEIAAQIVCMTSDAMPSATLPAGGQAAAPPSPPGCSGHRAWPASPPGAARGTLP